jgi:hypothetical protein
LDLRNAGCMSHHHFWSEIPNSAGSISTGMVSYGRIPFLDLETQRDHSEGRLPTGKLPWNEVSQCCMNWSILFAP